VKMLAGNVSVDFDVSWSVFHVTTVCVEASLAAAVKIARSPGKARDPAAVVEVRPSDLPLVSASINNDLLNLTFHSRFRQLRTCLPLSMEGSQQTCLLLLCYVLQSELKQQSVMPHSRDTN
jgi:hypothetical protein